MKTHLPPYQGRTRGRQLLAVATMVAFALGLSVTRSAVTGQDGDKAQERTEQILDLVAQLNADTLAERTAAEKALIKLGPSILPQLPATTDDTPAQLRQRLMVIRQELEKQVAASITQPTTVNLTGIFTLSQVAEALRKQTGNQLLVPENAGDQDVQVEFEKVPFWRAADKVLDQVAMDIVALGGKPNQLVLTARPPETRSRFGNADYNGVFRIEPIRVFSVRDLRNPGLDVMRVTLSVSWEPRLSPISMVHDMSTIRAEDGKGKQWPSSATGRRDLSIQPGMSGVEIELPLPLLERGTQSLASLQGDLEVLVPGQVEKFVFEGDLPTARGVEIKRAGATVILDQIRESGPIQQVRIRVRFEEASNALESHRGWVFSNKAYLVGPNGEEVPNAGLESTGQSDNEVGVAYLFAQEDGLKGYKFVYETPATIIRRTVHYEVTDIALP